MLKSMTAYSFVEEIEGDVNIAIEMRTYNSRNAMSKCRLFYVRISIAMFTSPSIS